MVISQLKTLIITTGVKKWLVEILLPSLYSKGKYSGNVLIMNYGDFNEVDKTEVYLLYEHLVEFYDTKLMWKTFTVDRFRVFTKVLGKKYNEYDVIMHIDGNDMEFFGDINPLLIQGEKSLCFYEEPRNNDNYIIRKWLTLSSLSEIEWDTIKDRPVLNAGMFLGPAEDVYLLMRSIVLFSMRDTRYGMDQLALNYLVYSAEIPYTKLGGEWDTHYYDITWYYDTNNNPILKDGTSIKILHYAGKNRVKSKSDKKVNWLFRN